MLRQLLYSGLIFVLPLQLSAQTPVKELSKTAEKQEKKFLKNDIYVKIPAGTLTKNIEAGETEQVEMDNYFMLNREVTNIDYREFLHYYKERDTAKYSAYMPDSTVWRTKNTYMEPMVNLYSNHPAYYNYPVVGVTYNQAKAYCAWLTEIINNNADKIFKKVLYRLPTEDEWIYAANGGKDNSIFPWEGDFLTTADGDFKANCTTFTPENIYRDTLFQKNEKGEFEEVYIYRTHPGGFNGVRGVLNDAADLTAPSKSYYPNGFGLYNMAGNVAEMVAEPGITQYKH